MNKMNNGKIGMAMAVAGLLGLTGCNGDKKPEHPKKEHPAKPDHPKGEHPK